MFLVDLLPPNWFKFKYENFNEYIFHYCVPIFNDSSQKTSDAHQDVAVVI